MKFSIRPADNIIVLEGRFTYADHDLFRGVLDHLGRPGRGRPVFDLSQLTFMDSAGLGMLLLARETAEANGADLVLRGAAGPVLRLLTASRFETIFAVET